MEEKKSEAAPISRKEEFVMFLRWVGRWLGIQTKTEREEARAARAYGAKVEALAQAINKGEVILTSRPKWLRQSEFIQMRRLQSKVTKRNLNRVGNGKSSY